MFSGLFKYNVWIASVALISIILAAVYTLWMVQKVFYGPERVSGQLAVTLPLATKMMLSLLVLVIIISGVYPQPMIDLTNDTITKIVAQIK